MYELWAYGACLVFGYILGVFITKEDYNNRDKGKY